MNGIRPHFDSSKIKNMNSMFLGYDTIEYINFTNFNTSSATDMSKMFQNCTNLKHLNLSSFDTSSVTDMSNMLSGCDSLEYIDISNMAENEMIKKELSSLNSKKDLLICQTSDIIQDVNTACCDVYTDENKICHTNNYIKVQYGESTSYPNGFGNKNRDAVVFIMYKDTYYLKNESLNIDPNGTIEIYFGYPVKSLVAFFGYESSSKSGDENVENIVSVDLSNFDSSLINDTHSMCQGCTSLKEINFTNFDTSSITDINSMFKGCSSLESLDLS